MTETYCTQDEDFAAGVVVDHIDGVMAEMLIDELFSNSLELA